MLLTRTPQGVELDPAGADLLERADAILAQVAAARAAMDEHAGVVRGHARVAATAADALGLPAALAAFHAEHPGIRLALRHGSAAEVAAPGAHGVGRRRGRRRPRRRSVREAGLEVRPLAEEPLRVLAAPGDPLVGGGPVAIGDLAGRPLILPERGTALRATVMAACQAAGFSPVPQVEAADPAAVRELAAAGVGVAVVPASWLAGPGPATGRRAAGRARARAPHGAAVAPGASPAGLLLAARLPDLLGRAASARAPRRARPPGARRGRAPIERAHGRAVAEEDERRHREDAVARRRDLVGVDVDLHDAQVVARGVQRVQDRLHGPARRAPGGGEVDQDGAVGLEDLGREGGVGDGGEGEEVVLMRPMLPRRAGFVQERLVMDLISAGGEQVVRYPSAMAVATDPFLEKTDEQQAIIEMVRQFVDEQIIPNAEHYDGEDEFPEPIVEQMKELGLFGITIPEEYGGLGLDLTTYTMVVEELSRGWISISGDHQHALHRLLPAAEVRDRRAEAEVPAAHGDRRAARRLLALRARARLRRPGHQDLGQEGRRRRTTRSTARRCGSPTACGPASSSCWSRPTPTPSRATRA